MTNLVHPHTYRISLNLVREWLENKFYATNFDFF